MPRKQKTLHIVTEILALPVGIYLIYLGGTLDINIFHRIALGVIGFGNLIIDGYLLYKWLR